MGVITGTLDDGTFRVAYTDGDSENGVPARFTVHVVDFPDQAASYELYSVALLQRELQPKKSKL